MSKSVEHRVGSGLREAAPPRITASLAAFAALCLTASASAQQHVHQHDLSPASVESAPLSSLAEIDPDFELTGRDGELIRDEDFLGKYLLLGFGFTRCTDVCPLMALNMARVLQAIGKPAAGVFISVDTERDTPTTVDDYTRRFDERILGLSGSVEQINAAVNNFNARYVVTKTQDGVTVQHTSYIYVIDPAGTLLEVFAFSTPTEEIAAALE